MITQNLSSDERSIKKLGNITDPWGKHFSEFQGNFL